MTDLVSDNVNLAYKVAQKWLSKLPHESDEIISDALLGLVKAAERFDPELGFTFSTYAWRIIDGEVAHGVRGRFRRIQKGDISLTALAGEHSDEFPLEHVETGYDSVESQIDADLLLTGLTDIQRQVVILHSCEGMSYAEIGEHMGFSRQAAHRHYTSAMERLRA